MEMASIKALLLLYIEFGNWWLVSRNWATDVYQTSKVSCLTFRGFHTIGWVSDEQVLFFVLITLQRYPGRYEGMNAMDSRELFVLQQHEKRDAAWNLIVIAILNSLHELLIAPRFENDMYIYMHIVFQMTTNSHHPYSITRMDATYRLG